MTLNTIPKNLWQVTVPNMTKHTRIFTTRQEVRGYRRTLRTDGINNSKTMRFGVTSGTAANL